LRAEKMPNSLRLPTPPFGETVVAMQPFNRFTSEGARKTREDC